VAHDKPENLAASVSVAKVKLVVGDGLKRTIEYATKKKFVHIVDNRTIEIDVDEQDVSMLLSGLAKVGVHYTHITIEKPTLEDYFLEMTRDGKLGREKEESL
jgi:hypothetical protein